MRHRSKLKIIAIIVMLLGTASTIVVAANNNNANNNTALMPKTGNLIFCPPPTALKKHPVKMNWTAYGGIWKSYHSSFVNKVDKFLGAQWNGATVGQITCVYQGEPQESFPVLLVFHILSQEPHTGKWKLIIKGKATQEITSKWSKNLGGIRNCVASDPKKCPFQVLQKPKQGDIYQEAEQLKTQEF